MSQSEFVKINVGRLSESEVANISREVRGLWRNLQNVYPNGDKNQRAQLKVTRDSYGQYHFYLNHHALQLILLFCKNMPDPLSEQAAGVARAIRNGRQPE